jgi:hypothetical protein
MAYKVFQSNPAATTPADLYTVPSAKEAVISTIAVCNHGATNVFSIWIRKAGATAADVHLLANGVGVAADETFFITAGIALAATDVVTVEAGTGDMTFQAFVNEVDA